MHTLAPLIQDLAVILGVASIVTLLFQRIRQPIVLGYLVAGIIIGPYTPPHALVNDIPNIKILSELGVIFLMFSLGLEFNFSKLTRVGISAGITGILEVMLMIFLGIMTGKLLGWPFLDCLFLGAALAISSTTIIIKAITELGLTKKRFAELIFGILVVEDLLAILLIVGLSTIVETQNIFSISIAAAAGKLALVVSGWFIVGYFVIPTILRKVMAYASEETITIVSIGLCLFLVSLAAHFQYSTALGAFIMGSILAETHIIKRIEHLTKPIRDVFAAVFFVSVGMLMNPKIIIQQWQIVLLITAITIVGKLLTSGFGALLSGQSLNTSLRIGFSMAQVGEFSFIIIGLGLILNAISPSLYPIIVAVAVITTFTTPYMIRFSGYLIKKINSNLSDRTKNLFQRYSHVAQDVVSETRQISSQKNMATRIAINGVVIAIIFTLMNQYVFDWTKDIAPQTWPIKNIVGIMSLLLSAPFIWGILFSFEVNHSIKTKAYLNPSAYLACLLTIIEIAFLCDLYFFSWPGALLITIIFLLLIIFFNKPLEKTYHWFENHLVKNINN